MYRFPSLFVVLRIIPKLKPALCPTRVGQGLGLTTYKGYKLNVNAKANEKKQKKKKEKDEGEASPSRGGHDEQQNPATTHQPCNDVVPR